MAEGVVDFAAGWISGAVGIVLTQPLDGVLVRVQTKGTSSGSLPFAVNNVATAGGLRAFWRGAAPMLWSVPVQNAFLFGGYGVGLGWCSRESANTDASQSLWNVFIGGCIGGLAQSFIMSPVELVKVRLQLADRTVAGAGGRGAVGTLSLVGTIVRSLGVLGTLSRGLGATLGRDVMPHGVWFVTYEGCKREFSRREGVRASDNCALSVSSQLASGGIAAATAWFVGYPFDVIKTRVQSISICDVGAPPRTGMLHTARRMAKVEGLSVFYRGFSLKLARAIPMSMIGFFAYEAAARELRSLMSSSS